MSAAWTSALMENCGAKWEFADEAVFPRSVEKFCGGRPERGKFIVFDGIDGSGKGTHVSLLARVLTKMGIRYALTKQPGGSRYGDEIRKILFDTIGTANIEPDALELLFMSNHAQNCAEVERYLSAGLWVIADRWSPSAIAYMEQRGASDQVKSWYESIANRVEWDVFFLLTGDPKILLKRARARVGSKVDGAHQAAKKWNSEEAMWIIDHAYKVGFQRDHRTVMIKTDVTTTCQELQYSVLPALASRLGLRVPDQVVEEVIRAN